MNAVPRSRPDPAAALVELRSALPGLTVSRRRHPDGGPFLSVANPHPGGQPLRIDLDGAPALHFGPHHDHYEPTPDGWRDLIADASQIVAGTIVTCTGTDADASWKWHTFLDTSSTPLATDADAFRFLAHSQWNNIAGELLVRSARVGAVLDVLAWNPAGNRHFALSPDWFQTLVRPTGLDYLLAAVEVQSTPGGFLLDAFSFGAGGDTFECRRDGSRWVLRPAPWTCPPRKRRILASAPTLDAILDTPLPETDTTIRAALAALPSWDIFIQRARGEDDTPWTFETPLDTIGLCGLFDDWVQCPARFLSVTLRPDESAAILPFVSKLNARLGLGIVKNASPCLLPSRCAAAALDLLRAWLARQRRPAVREAAAKLLPVFESAAALRMPVSCRFR